MAMFSYNVGQTEGPRNGIVTTKPARLVRHRPAFRDRTDINHTKKWTATKTANA
jgi:hypothetical protein